MHSSSFSLIFLLALLGAVFVMFVSTIERAHAPVLDRPETAEVVEAPATTTITAFPESKNAVEKKKIEMPLVKATSTQEVQASASKTAVSRIENPYPFPPLSQDVLNAAARASLVNIICTVGGVADSITGSGVIIDPRGIVLTNAHVGQYVLLSETASNISCVGRTGAPAQAKWRLKVMFIPSRWVEAHAKDLKLEHPTGTGEHDYALLLAEPFDPQSPPLMGLPALPFDIREAVAFDNDQVLLASYPAGFLGNYVTQNNLYPMTTIASIANLYTFSEKYIDLLSLGGVIVAQGGSSGGAVVNRWGRLVGVIVTTSDGATTAERDLRAITLAHIDRSIREHTGGMSLAELIGPEAQAHSNDFRTTQLPTITKLILDQLPH